MKKLVSLLLAMAMVFGLTACTGNKPSNSQPADPSQNASQNMGPSQGADKMYAQGVTDTTIKIANSAGHLRLLRPRRRALQRRYSGLSEHGQRLRRH